MIQLTKETTKQITTTKGQTKRISIKSFFDEDKRFNVELFVKHFESCFKIIKIVKNNSTQIAERVSSPLYWYEELHNRYTLFTREVFEKNVTSVYSGVRINQRKEAWELLKSKAAIKDEQPQFIALKNGVLNVRNGKLSEFSSDIITTNFIDIKYDKEVTTHKKVDDFIVDLFGNDSDMKKFIFECIGYVFSEDNFLGKFFIFTGAGGNGKSAFLKMLNAFFGSHNSSKLSLEQLGQRFQTCKLDGKLLNIGMELEDKNIKSSAILKSVVTGDPLYVEIKHGATYTLNPRTKLFFAANKPPCIEDTSQGMLDRTVIVPFDNRVRETKNADPNIHINVLKNGGDSYILNNALEGLKRLKKNNRFTLPQKIIEKTLRFNTDNNYVALFIEAVNSDEGVQIGNFEVFQDRPNTLYSIIYQPFSVVYEAYRTWIKKSGDKEMEKKVLSKVNFSKELQKLGYTTKQEKYNGKNRRVIVKA